MDSVGIESHRIERERVEAHAEQPQVNDEGQVRRRERHAESDAFERDLVHREGHAATGAGRGVGRCAGRERPNDVLEVEAAVGLLAQLGVHVKEPHMAQRDPVVEQGGDIQVGLDEPGIEQRIAAVVGYT